MGGADSAPRRLQRGPSGLAIQLLALLAAAIPCLSGEPAVVRSVQPHRVVTSAGSIPWSSVRGVVLVSSSGRGKTSRQVLSPGDRVDLSPAGLLEVHTGQFAGILVDSRYGDLLLRSAAGHGLNLIAPADLDVRLNGLPEKLESLPAGHSTFARYDPGTGTAGRLEVVDPARSDPGRIWEVAAGRRPGDQKPDRPLRAGEELHLRMKAPRGARASFDITGQVWGIPAFESEPGVYRAIWRITPGMDLRAAYVLGRWGDKVRIGPRVSLAASAPVLDELGPIGEAAPSGPIFARYSSAAAAIDPARVRLRVDGQDVTARADRRPDLVFYQPPSPLTRGVYRVELQVGDAAGNLTRRHWEFSVR
ncbi:MAG: hypothetical protein HY319_27795 [Armatimonadetes bacterium]|nr:hypothetical protein [Armatimonadota bacterium]